MDKWDIIGIIAVVGILAAGGGIATSIAKKTEEISEIPGTKVRVDRQQIEQLPDGSIVIHGLNPSVQVQTVQDTNSMNPMIDIGMWLIMEPVTDIGILAVGDIIEFHKPDDPESYILHRIVEIGNDLQGWYCRTMGDNTDNTIDPWKLRSENILFVFRGLIS